MHSMEPFTMRAVHFLRVGLRGGCADKVVCCATLLIFSRIDYILSQLEITLIFVLT